MKAMILLSGGIDSTTCLAMAIERYGKESVSAINIFYGQKHSRERKSAEDVASYYGVGLEEYDLHDIMKSSQCPLLDISGKDIPHLSYADQIAEREGTVQTYVPFRNGLMLSIATSRAYILGCEEVWYGAHADDAAGRAYPDCTQEFAEYMGKSITEGTGGRVGLVAPILNINKAGVVKEGLRLHVPYELTWSCYEGKSKPCHKCGTCIDRENAFVINGTTDPLCR